MILHIPHSSTRMINSVKVDNLKRNIDLLTDWFVDDLFEYPGEKAHPVIFEYSRLVVDVERFKSDCMDEFGKGFAYQTDIDGYPINRDIDECVRLYDEYHLRFTNLVNEYLALFPRVVIVDCHTFNNDPLPWERISISPRPDICIGVSDDNINTSLVDRVIHHLIDKDISFLINTPYSGSMVPKHFIGHPDVHSIMIEVNKSLYLNNEYGKSDSFDRCKGIITGVLDIIHEWQKDQ